MQGHDNNILQEPLDSDSSTKRLQFQTTKLLKPTLSPRVTYRCLKEPSAYEEIVKQLREATKKHHSRSIRHLEENWQAERETYELFYETVAALREGDWSANAFGLPTHNEEGRRRSVHGFRRRSLKSLPGPSIHHRLALLSSLHVSICCDWYGNEGVGIHRWSASGNEVTLSWQRFYSQFDATISEKACSSTMEENLRLSSDFFSISGSSNMSFTLPRDLAIIDDLEAYVVMPRKPRARFSRPVVSRTSGTRTLPLIKFSCSETGSESTLHHLNELSGGRELKSDDEDVDDIEYVGPLNYSSSEFDTDISVDEDGDFIVKTEAERKHARAKRKSGNDEWGQTKSISITESEKPGSTASSLETNSTFLPIPAKRTKRLMLKRLGEMRKICAEDELPLSLMRVRSTYGLASSTNSLRQRIYSEIMDQEHPIGVGTLSREVIKRVPQVYSSEGDSPDISVGSNIDESLVEATVEGVLKGCPVMVKTLLRKNRTVLPTHREILPLVQDVNLRSDQPIKKPMNNIFTEQFVFDSRIDERPKGSYCYFLETVLPVSSINPDDFGTNDVMEEKGSAEGGKVGFGALLQHLRSTTPDPCPYQSSLNNVSTSVIAERQNPYFRQAILHTGLKKPTTNLDNRNWIMRPPRGLQIQMNNYTSNISIPCVLLLPPKKFHFSMLTHLEELMDGINPLLISLMNRIWRSARPIGAWVLERDKKTLDYALNKLILDLILFRHATGHCVRYKALSVITSSHQNSRLRELLVESAAHPGNWLDQILRSGLSIYSSCRLEAAICLLGLVTDKELISRVGMKGVRPMIIDIFISLFRLADMFEDTAPVFFVVMTYLVCHNEDRTLLETIVKYGSTAKTTFLVGQWPYLVAFAYTYWSRRRLLSFTLRESLLVKALDEAWRNPVSRRAAREAMKAIKEFVEVVSSFHTHWPVRQKRTPMVHEN
ncbi:unnamed protein product [Hydatigera taeniaeformis]|uniref:Rho-GAP domain-containing protein n=1 Tax=Hydatigena taeniaeformis TaxID=6205 RepID=A0A0R3X0C0_HYDTA|nr:unnamed protein product [Hydatigera taeniaeformis]